MGSARRRRHRGRQDRQDAARCAPRLDPRTEGRAQGTGDDAHRQGLHERERRPAQGARAVREPSSDREPARCAKPVPEREPHHRPREHRRPLLGPRACRRSRCGRKPEDHHGRCVETHCQVRVRVRAEVRPHARYRHPQGEHHEARRRAVSRLGSSRRGRIPGHPVRRSHHRRGVHAPGHETRTVRRAGAPEPLR